MTERMKELQAKNVDRILRRLALAEKIEALDRKIEIVLDALREEVDDIETEMLWAMEEPTNPERLAPYKAIIDAETTDDQIAAMVEHLQENYGRNLWHQKASLCTDNEDDNEEAFRDALEIMRRLQRLDTAELTAYRDRLRCEAQWDSITAETTDAEIGVMSHSIDAFQQLTSRRNDLRKCEK